MILLLGGTSETPKIANLLAQKNNCRVLISNLTDSVVEWDLNSDVFVRHGALNNTGMSDLITRQGITAIVDASHPYAEQLHNTALEVSIKTQTPYYRYERPGIDYSGCDVKFADNHQKAAAVTFETGRRALLTSGTRNLKPYIETAKKTGSKLYIRILPCKESMNVCKKNGIGNDRIIVMQGPFTIEQNIGIIKKYSIDVMVTKDSGIAGGVSEKLKAAKACAAKIIVVRKPPANQNLPNSFTAISELIKRVVV